MSIHRKSHLNLFASWLISYIVLLCIIIISSIIIYLISLNIIEQENNEKNMLMMKQIQQIIDGNNEEVQKLSYQIGMNYHVESFMHYNDETEANRINIMVKMIASFKKFYTTSNIKNFYVYFFDADFIINPSAKYDNELFYSSTHNVELNGYDDWYNTITTSHTNEIVTFVVNENNDERVLDIAYIQSIPITETRNPLANIVILYEEKKLMRLIDNIGITNQGSVFIINGRNEIIFKSDSSESIDSILLVNEMDEQAKSFYLDFHGEDFVVTYVKSVNTDWKYVSLVKKSVYEEKVSQIKNVSLVGILFSLLLGIITSYFFTLRNYKPVNNIINRLIDKPNSFKSSHENEYDFINQRLKTLINDNKAYEYEHKKKDYTSALIKLIKGKKVISTNFNFISESFALVLCPIENEESKEQDHYQSMGLEEILNTLYELDSIENKDFKIYTLLDENKVICLINFSEGMNKNQYIKHLLDISVKLFMVLQKKIGNQVFIANSLVHDGIEQIPVCYSEVEKTLESRIFFDDNILSYTKIVNLTNNYSYTLDNENKLIGYMISGDVIKAQEHFGTIYRNNIQNIKITINGLKSFIVEIESTIIKVCNNIGCTQEYIDRIIPFKEISHFKTTNEFKGYLDNIILDICTLVDENRKSHNFKMRDEIIKMVNNNYSDINMNIAIMADRLEISSSYLSNFFKEQTGQKLLDYINKTRFTKAKELLADDSLNLSEISSRVGLHDSHALIRLFKKYSGMTPGKFREIGQDGMTGKKEN